MCVLVYQCLHDAAPTYLAEMCTPVSKSSPLCNTWRSGSTSLQDNEIWTTMFHCFWSHFVEQNVADRV